MFYKFFAGLIAVLSFYIKSFKLNRALIKKIFFRGCLKTAVANKTHIPLGLFQLYGST